jgi:hypothetical protein
MTRTTTQRETPKFTGVTTYRDPLGRFSIRYPSDWATFEIRDGLPPLSKRAQRALQTREGRARQTAKVLATARKANEAQPIPAREGFGFAPNPADPHTSFTVWVSPLAERVVAEDLPELKAGVDAGLAALQQCRIEAAQDDTLSNLVKFERIYTFHDGEATRKRKQWLLYVDTWMMCLTYQGSSPEEFQYWYAMANQSFFGFELPYELWFMTDRDLMGQPRRTPEQTAEDEWARRASARPTGDLPV